MDGGHQELRKIPGIEFVDHVAIAIPGAIWTPRSSAYELLGFREVHREDVLGTDQVREALLQIGDGPNLLQLLEPLSPARLLKRQLRGTADGAAWP